MNLRYGRAAQWIAAVMLAGGIVAAQTAYTPKFPGDPARSDSEAAALGYMRTVMRAGKLYKRKNNQFATSLSVLVQMGSVSGRVVNPIRVE